MKLYHGTSTLHLASIRKGINPGTYVSTTFEIAAYYALRTKLPCVIELNCSVKTPAEQAYPQDRITTEETRPIAIYQYIEAIPADWYELTGIQRKYPNLFRKKNWRIK